MNKFLTFAAAFFLIGCGGGSSIDKQIKKLSPDTTWQWQLQGDLNSSYDVDLYDIDLFDTPKSVIEKLHKEGRLVICYFSAGSYENWREDKDEFPQEALGNELEGWEGEKWLDIRNKKVQDIMKSRMELAKDKGCDGVEPDNVDGYSNDTGFDLTPSDQLKYNKFIAKTAHGLGLLVGLKNDLNQISKLQPHFDFALNEECHEFDECNLLEPFTKANKPVFNAEYAQKYVKNSNGARDKLCQKAKEEGFRTLILPVKLDDSFRYSCD